MNGAFILVADMPHFARPLTTTTLRVVARRCVWWMPHPKPYILALDSDSDPPYRPRELTPKLP